MSFLAGRLASTEGAYFLQQSKQAVTRIINNQKIINNNTTIIPNSSSSAVLEENDKEEIADVLPEVLRHSLPSKIFNSTLDNSDTYSLTKTSKWELKTNQQGSFVYREAINPLSAYVSLPQVTFGAKRWQLPNSSNSVVASTANDLRQDKYAPINPDKVKAAAEGLFQIGSAFAIATTLVFGGSVVIFGIIASKLEFQNTDDIRTKGKEIVQPRFESYKDQLAPIRSWAEDMSKKWHFEREENSLKDKTLARQLSRTLGTKTST